ncbi:MAG TPA: phosphate ABC transporter permease PstA [Frankiaceae bacterium]|nr:phosphate ABC transporter permease PstA [Frankiaceae bacterium]
MTVRLAAPTLPRWAPVALGGAAAALTALLVALTPAQGRAGTLVVFLAGYAAVLTVASYAVEGRRRAADRLARVLIAGAVGAALTPLVLVLGYTVARGAKGLTGYFLYHSMRGIGPLDTHGGIYHSLLGTLEQVGLAIALAVPLGLLTAVYITEFGRGRLAAAVRFVVDVMTGIPSIVSGLFVLAFWVIGLGQGFSGFAASISLAILMLPVVVRSAEEMIRLVPDSLREASYALGVPRWKTVTSVVLPTASAGITTGVMLAVARVTGETAPLLLTAFGFDSIRRNPFKGPQSGLPLYVFDQATSSARGAVDRAWAAALALILVVVLLYVAARLVTRRNRLGGTS